MRILLQFPEGLKPYAAAEALKLEKEGHTVFLSATPCWGACDLALDEAQKINAGKLIHYGHAQFGDRAVKSGGIEIEYRLYPITVDLGVLEEALPLLKNYKKLALVTTVSHAHQLPKMRSILQSAGHEVLTSRGALAILEGQVLGCDSSAADKLSGQADAIVYFGGGEFHPLGIGGSRAGVSGNARAVTHAAAQASGEKPGTPAGPGADKPVFSVNPYARSASQINDLLLRKRRQERGMLIAASQAGRIGILVSTKSGQFNLGAAENAKKKLLALGVPQVSILVTGEVDFHAVQDFNAFDAYLTTACPRLIDDAERLGKPVVNLSMLPELLSLIKATQPKK